jgi:hypothetical protein
MLGHYATRPPAQNQKQGAGTGADRSSRKRNAVMTLWLSCCRHLYSGIGFSSSDLNFEAYSLRL